MTRRRILYAAFVLSGAAGLVYEVVWTRYLALYVGHSAYAQVVVLGVYLGGMALGAALVSRWAPGLKNPLRWYAGAEGLLALGGLGFHTAFSVATGVAYDVVIPALGGGALVTVFLWGSAALLVLPPAAILGATFPLMAAGLVREDTARPGQGVAAAYLANALGGAAGVVAAGFFFIGWWGLPGTLLSAALLNAGAAVLALRAGTPRPDPWGVPPSRSPGASSARLDWPDDRTHLVRLLLAVSFGTAVASFAYEVGWIRMLSLLLGSATHSFELMLSAFILGIGLGAWLIKDWTDGTEDPLRLLGGVQVIMGLAAVATLPLYLISFDAMGGLVNGLPAQGGGYAVFNAGRYALCMAIMLPATVMAGMTLPIITGTLLRAGEDEGAIGRVYAANTLGSVVGVALSGLVLLPVLGLRGLLVAGAALDIALGAMALSASPHPGRARGLARAVGIACGAGLLAAALLFRLDPAVVTSGVFRTGDVAGPRGWSVLYYRDGRTATVSAHETADGLRLISTNGKPDASLETRWLTPPADTLPLRPIGAGTDFTTQILAPMVALAHAPDARLAVNIGHGSGMSGTALLASDALETLVTVEIEPAMVEGSRVFLPANRAVFDDPRSTVVYGDARAYFAASPRRFDVIFGEPSNPWVSGTASLFTVEFYSRLATHLAPGGILGQWIQLYELNDELFLSVVAALDEVFPSYRAYLVAGSDVAVVASLDDSLPDPDWSVLSLPRFRSIGEGAPPFRPDDMAPLLLFDESTMRPVLDGSVPVNSDFAPFLDLGAERARFLRQNADGFRTLSARRVDLRGLGDHGRGAPAAAGVLPALGLDPLVLRSRAAWIRDPEASTPPGELADAWHETRDALEAFLGEMAGDVQPRDWRRWSVAMAELESVVHAGTWGWSDTSFVRPVETFLEEHSPPAEAVAAASLLAGLRALDWRRAADAADTLVPAAVAGAWWMPPELLLDAAVLAYAREGRTTDAQRALRTLAEPAGVERDGLRFRLLQALARDGTGTSDAGSP